MSVPAFWDEAKEYVDLVSNLMVEAGKAAHISVDGADMVRSDLMSFAMYLSASDGTVSRDEAAFFTHVFSLPSLSSDAAASIIASNARENNIYSKEYETKVPTSLQFTVAMDNARLDSGIVPDNGSITKVLLQVYEMIGTHIIKSDGNVAANEVKDFKIYMKTLHDFVNTNYKGTLSTDFNSNSSDTTGFVKQ